MPNVRKVRVTGNRLRHVRKVYRVTGEMLAKQMGITPDYLYRIERGDEPIPCFPMCTDEPTHRRRPLIGDRGDPMRFVVYYLDSLLAIAAIPHPKHIRKIINAAPEEARREISPSNRRQIQKQRRQWLSIFRQEARAARESKEKA